MGNLSKEQSYELLDAFFAAGGRSIDTANVYQVSQLRYTEPQLMSRTMIAKAESVTGCKNEGTVTRW
jgi:aryl-alcohol dehydrogenase-like predicted oxidoreductase